MTGLRWILGKCVRAMLGGSGRLVRVPIVADAQEDTVAVAPEPEQAAPEPALSPLTALAMRPLLRWVSLAAHVPAEAPPSEEPEGGDGE